MVDSGRCAAMLQALGLRAVTKAELCGFGGCRHGVGRNNRFSGRWGRVRKKIKPFAVSEGASV
jgi:hypothetical protein